jgi:hypothetical protein
VLPDLATVTPAQSDASEPNSPASVQDESNRSATLDRADNGDELDVDMEMDMDETDFDFVVGSPPPDSPAVNSFRPPPMRPAKLDPTLFGQDSGRSNTGRIPTPMYPNFPASRGTAHSTGGIGYPTSGMAGGIGAMSLPGGLLSVPKEPILQTPPVSKKQGYIEQDRSRRMPSPISEDEDLPDTPTAFAQSKLSRLTVASIPEHMDYETTEGEPPPPGVVTTPTTGRKRSGALSGRGKFSIGYRDDCEKCNQRVPGHFAHFLP